MRLHTTPKSANGLKALVAARHLGIDVDTQIVDVYAGDGRRPEYLALNPLGKVPTLVDGDRVLTESNAILLHLSTAEGWEQADMARWLFWEAAHWQPVLTRLLAPTVGYRLGLAPVPPAAVDWDDTEFGRMARHLEAHLADRAWLVGDAMSVADIGVAAMLVYVGGRLPQPAIRRWFADVADTAAWTTSVADSPWAAPYGLRPTTDADFDSVHAWREQAYRSYVERHFGPWDDVDQREGLRRRWGIRDQRVVVLGADDVGYIDVADEPDGFLIGNIILSPDLRGRGLGSAVMRDLLRGRSAARLKVFRDNPAVRLYERLGFKVTETVGPQVWMRREA